MVSTVDPESIKIPDTDLDDGDYDCFEMFERMQGAGRADPHPTYAEKRRTSPVERMSVQASLGLDEDVPVTSELEVGPATFTVYGFDEVIEVLQDSERFSSDTYTNLMGPVFGRSILEMDDPDHRHHRSLVAQAFRPKVLKRWESELIEPVITELVDGFAERGQIDLQSAFTFVYPVKVISGLLGVPLEHWEWYRRRAIEVISLVINWDRAIKASEVLADYFRQIIHVRRAEPRGDLISELVQAEMDGHKLSDEEILPFLMLLSPAGAETTFRSTGNLLYGLFRNPDQLEALRADRSLLPRAIEEAVRWEPPLTFIYRRATRDTEVGGVSIPQGSTMAVSIGSANRSKKVFGEDAEDFNIFREPKHHAAFATGAHMCLGMHLARLEMRLACNILFDRLPNLRLDPERADDVFIDGVIFRSPNMLPVVWDV